MTTSEREPEHRRTDLKREHVRADRLQQPDYDHSDRNIILSYIPESPFERQHDKMPRIGKSQLVTMAAAWHCARNDELSNLYVTYSNTLGGAFVDGVLELIKDPTYAFGEVFPDERVANTDSEAHRMNLTRQKKYATLSGRGMEAGLNGQFDADRKSVV